MQIIIYTKPGCVQCTATTRYLDARGVTYRTEDVTADTAALDAVRQLGYAAAPVVVAGDQHWSGFQPGKLDQLT